MKAIEMLLENYWYIKEDNEELYNKVKLELDSETQKFIKEKLGYKIIFNQNMIKLEKLPGKPQAFMGIQEFDKKIEYVFLCMILMYLETKAKKEQFILSGLIDYIQNLSLELKLNDINIDFNLYYQRTSMVKVLKYIKEIGFIKLHDGNESGFSDNSENDVLYEVTAISKYFVKNFLINITECSDYKEIFEKEQLGLEQDKGLERRHRIYRRIFTESVVYNEQKDDLDYMYIKQYKNTIEQDVEKMLDAKFEVHKNGAYIVVPEGQNFSNTFPNRKGISDVVMFLNTYIIDKINNENNGNKIFQKNIDDTFNISKIKFREIVEETILKYGKGFSKEYRDLTILDKTKDQVVVFMKEFDMLREKEDTKEYIIMPIIFRIKGKYPSDFDYE